MLTADGFLFRLLLSIAIAWIGLTAMTSGVKSLKGCWEVLTTDSMSIAEAIATNEVSQIRGRVRPTQSDSALLSPLRNKQCVAYKYNISKIVQDTGRSCIDSDITYSSFIISDGTADILANPDEGSLSLNMTANRPTSKREIMEQTADDRLEVEPSVYTSVFGDTTKPIEVSEGTIDVGEKITIVGKATSVPAEAVTNVDAVMMSEEAHLTVMNDDSGNTALRKAGRGGFLLLFGLIFGAFAILILTPVVLEIVATVG